MYVEVDVLDGVMNYGQVCMHLNKVRTLTIVMVRIYSLVIYY